MMLWCSKHGSIHAYIPAQTEEEIPQLEILSDPIKWCKYIRCYNFRANPISNEGFTAHAHADFSESCYRTLQDSWPHVGRMALQPYGLRSWWIQSRKCRLSFLCRARRALWAKERAVCVPCGWAGLLIPTGLGGWDSDGHISSIPAEGYNTSCINIVLSSERWCGRKTIIFQRNLLLMPTYNPVRVRSPFWNPYPAHLLVQTDRVTISPKRTHSRDEPKRNSYQLFKYIFNMSKSSANVTFSKAVRNALWISPAWTVRGLSDPCTICPLKSFRGCCLATCVSLCRRGSTFSREEDQFGFSVQFGASLSIRWRRLWDSRPDVAADGETDGGTQAVLCKVSVKSLQTT